MKRVAIVGSTGSIGQSALAVIAAHPQRLQVVALAAGENALRLVEQVEASRVRTVAMAIVLPLSIAASTASSAAVPADAKRTTSASG